MYWTMDVEAGTLDMTITAKTGGWVGWGVAPTDSLGMVDSEAVVGHLTSPASTATVYRLVQRDASQFVNITAQIPLSNTNACTFTSGGATWSLVKFTRPINGGNNPISTTGETGMVIAYGSNGILSQHATNARTPFRLNLAGNSTSPSAPSAPGTPTATPTATPTSTPTATPTATPTSVPTDDTPSVAPSSATALLTVTAVFFVSLAALIAVAF